MQELMINPDSPILDFYPTTFEIDMNGKRMAWQGVALLPFIDEARLLDAIRPRYPLLTPDEHRRNSWGNNNLFIGDRHRLFDSFAFLYGRQRNDEVCLSPSIGMASDMSCRETHWILRSAMGSADPSNLIQNISLELHTRALSPK